METDKWYVIAFLKQDEKGYVVSDGACFVRGKYALDACSAAKDLGLIPSTTGAMSALVTDDDYLPPAEYLARYLPQDLFEQLAQDARKKFAQKELN